MSTVDELLAEHDIALIQADNPGPLTLDGTNSYLVGRNPTWLIDPGPAIDTHIQALLSEIERRGSLAGIALTHDHHDHCEALPALRAHTGVPIVAGGRGDVDLLLTDGVAVGPFVAISTPGHSADHFALLLNSVCFSGDAILGRGSVFIEPRPGALCAYLAALSRLQELDLKLICPGHGPPVPDPQSKLSEYIDHRAERERMLLAALAEGRRTAAQFLDRAWSDVPSLLRPAAAMSLKAHLYKLAAQGRLPEDLPNPEQLLNEWPSEPEGH